jgi:hypothetical protein
MVKTNNPPLIHIIEFGEDGAITRKPSMKWKGNTPVVDWTANRFAVNYYGTIKLYDLSTFEHIGFVPTLHTARPLAFSQDGQHLFTHEGKAIYRHYLASRPVSGLIQTYEPVREHELLKGPNGELWYVEQVDKVYGRKWKFLQATESGKPNYDITHMIDTGGPYGTPLGISFDGRHMVMATSKGCSHSVILVDLKTGFINYSLYPARSEYITPYFGIPHLPIRSGVDPGYLVGGLSNDSLYRMLHYANLAIKLKDRYDPIWFGMMSEIDRIYSPHAVSDFYTELASTTIQLRNAEKLLAKKQPDLALLSTREVIERLAKLKDKVQEHAFKDKVQEHAYTNQNILRLQEVITGYMPILEVEALLLRAKLAITLNRTDMAIQVIDRIFQINPLDWRAHEGRLYLNLDASDEAFFTLLSNTQKTLRLSGWTKEPIVGYPPSFFDESVIKKLRSAKRQAPK